MENWGLVTYREIDMLVDSNLGSSQHKQRVCSVVAHELAHQWFGNLVTMSWWDDLWLNEGFASWMQTFGNDFLFPEWKSWEQFSVDDMGFAFQLDSLLSSHPIQVPIAHAEEVQQVFDKISYSKGASVIRMLYAVLGHDDFRKGLQQYMVRHAYGNTETYHLWQVWEQVSGKPIQQMMGSWTEQMGFPLVTVNETRTEKAVTLELSQHWFLADGSSGDDRLWLIPILIATPETMHQPSLHLMRQAKETITIPLQSASDWVKLNAGQYGLYRVNYSSQMLERLAEAAKSKHLGPEDRAALIQDALALSKAGKLDVAEVVKLLSAYRDEDSYIVWNSISTAVSTLGSLLSRTSEETYREFSRFVMRLTDSLLRKVGWESNESETHLQKLLRGIVVTCASDHCDEQEDSEFIAVARAKFQNVVIENDHTKVASEVKLPLFRLVLRLGGEVEYTQLMAFHDKATDYIDKIRVYQSIGSTPSVELKRKSLLYNLDCVKLQDLKSVFGSVAASDAVGAVLSWQFFKENFSKIKSKLATAASSLLDGIITVATAELVLESEAADFESFFNANPLPASQRKISQVLENLRNTSALFQRVNQSPLANASFWKSQ
eukprot:c9808_g1_i2.p2 GENE.c9808_g1_i2~~c9808_g1_i2.p2  ORF type:complete len:619 (+),score=164.42 c9808_g1_i2:44-1858(+)